VFMRAMRVWAGFGKRRCRAGTTRPEITDKQAAKHTLAHGGVSDLRWPRARKSQCDMGESTRSDGFLVCPVSWEYGTNYVIFRLPPRQFGMLSRPPLDNFGGRLQQMNNNLLVILKTGCHESAHSTQQWLVAQCPELYSYTVKIHALC
jgi:hypothetical protein